MREVPWKSSRAAPVREIHATRRRTRRLHSHRLTSGCPPLKPGSTLAGTKRPFTTTHFAPNITCTTGGHGVDRAHSDYRRNTCNLVSCISVWGHSGRRCRRVPDTARFRAGRPGRPRRRAAVSAAPHGAGGGGRPGRDQPRTGMAGARQPAAALPLPWGMGGSCGTLLP